MLSSNTVFVSSLTALKRICAFNSSSLPSTVIVRLRFIVDSATVSALAFTADKSSIENTMKKQKKTDNTFLSFLFFTAPAARTEPLSINNTINNTYIWLSNVLAAVPLSCVTSTFSTVSVFSAGWELSGAGVTVTTFDFLI